MSSGYTGGGPDFFSGVTTGTAGGATTRRASIRNAGALMMGSVGQSGGTYRFQNQINFPHHHHQNQLMYQHERLQIPGMGIDPLSGQIGHRRIDLPVKRTLAEIQPYPHINLMQSQSQMGSNSTPLFHQLQQQQQQQNQILRSVKPRMIGIYNNSSASPVSTLSPPVDLSPPPGSILHLESSPATRYGVPLYQQLRQNPIINTTTNNDLANISTNPMANPSPSLDFLGSSGIGFSNLGPNRRPNSCDSKVNLTLQELEKQLFDDDEEGNDGEAVSVVTDSEWSVEFQKLVRPTQQQQQQPPPLASAPVVSPSPTSSSSSVSSSSSPPSIKQLITDAATLIDEGKKEAAMEILTRLSGLGSIKGNSEQRLAVYMSHALKSRVCPEEHAPAVTELRGAEHMGLVYVMYELSPFFKFGVLAANYVILETIASEKGKMVHVIDFDVGDGGQYVNLVRAVAERVGRVGGGGSFIPLRITAVETESGGGVSVGVVEARERLLKVAEQAGVNLRFDVKSLSIHELSREAIRCDEDETIVVNFSFKLYRVPDESVSMENFRDELLRRVKGLRPRVVTLVEQEMSLNTAPFLTRVNETCAYYGAVFESMDVTRSRDEPDRLRMEEAMGRKMENAVACEGRDRLERCEVFGKWKMRMGMAGFELRLLNPDVVGSMQEKLNSAPSGNPGFSVKEEGGGGVAFGWNGRTITVASSWR
ncbi:hypothetical protein Droror1_Dr00017760 [Drosera rotundifolia]